MSGRGDGVRRIRVTDKDGKAGFSKTITITVTP